MIKTPSNALPRPVSGTNPRRARLAACCALTLFGCGGAARADDDATAWRLQLPALSHHLSTKSAPLRGGTPSDDGENPPQFFYIGYPYTPGQSANQYCDDYASQAAGPASAGSVRAACLAQLRHPYVAGGKRRWNETNLGLGVEYNLRNPGTGVLRKYYAGTVVDSYFKTGAYAGTSYQWTLHYGPRLRVEAGASAMLWWRTVAEGDDQLRRRVVPLVLPVLSVEDRKTGIGANVSFVPRIQMHGQEYSVNTLILQFTWGL